MFGLQRSFITPNPKVDVNAFVGPRVGWAQGLVQHLRTTILSGRPPKMVIWGPFGVGKTHLLHLMSDKLKDVAQIIYVETPPCHRRTKFSEFHGAIMRRLGREEILRLLEDAIILPDKEGLTSTEQAIYRARLKAKEMFDESPVSPADIASKLNISQDIAVPLTKGLLEKNRGILWRYLSGERLTARELKAIDSVSQQIREDEAVEVLSLIARLVKRRDGRQLLLFIDEFENTLSLLGDSLTMFREAVRAMVSPDNDVGVLFVDSARDLSMVVSILTDDPVRRRIGYSNFIHFPEYSRDELRDVINDLLKYWRAGDFDAKEAADIASRTSKERVTPDSYPFTEEALSKIVEVPFILREAGKIDSIRPKESLEVADQALTIAMERRIDIIESSTVDEACRIFEFALGGKGPSWVSL